MRIGVKRLFLGTRERIAGAVYGTIVALLLWAGGSDRIPARPLAARRDRERLWC